MYGYKGVKSGNSSCFTPQGSNFLRNTLQRSNNTERSLFFCAALKMCCFLLQLEKVLQQGDISEASEPYLKARDLDKKILEKYKVNANYFCQQLGKYRMPFAWTAVNVLELLAKKQVLHPCHSKISVITLPPSLS